MGFASDRHLTSTEVLRREVMAEAAIAERDEDHAYECFNIAANLAATLIRANQRDLIPAILEAYRESIVDEFTDMDVMYDALADEKVTAAGHGIAGKAVA